MGSDQHAGEAFADAAREVVGTVRGLGTLIDVTPPAQGVERKALVQGPALVYELRKIAAQQHLPAQRHLRPDGLDMGHDVGGAVRGGGVVKLGPQVQLVDLR